MQRADEGGRYQIAFDAVTVRRLRFIRRAKELGFTLKEIGDLLDLRVDPTKSCVDVRALANVKSPMSRRR